MKVPPIIDDGLRVSRNIDQLLVVVRVSLHEATLDQVLDTLLDHFHVRLEQADVFDNTADEDIHSGGLERLHVAHCHRVNDVLTLHSDGLVDGAHDTVLGLVLDHLLSGELRDEVLLEGVALVLHVDENFLIRIFEVRLATRVLHHADLGLAKVRLEGLAQRRLVDAQLVHEHLHSDAVAVI